MKINEQLRSILFQLIRPAIAVALAAVAINFISAQIVATSKQINEKRTLYATLDKRAETVAKIEKDFESVGENAIETMDRTFLPADNILEFIEAMEGLASRNSVSQSLIFGTPTQFTKKGEGTSAASISTIDLNLNLGGNASNMVKYFTDLEKLPYLTSMTNLQITSNAAAGWESAGNIVAKGNFYTKSPE